MRKTPLRGIYGLLCLVLLGVLSAACTVINPQPDAAAAVTRYLEALADKNEIGMVNASCIAWESQARQEYASFAAVTVSLKDVRCTVLNQSEGTAQVSCDGQIIANYGAEDLVIELNERMYLVVDEGGEWRMCGYQ